MKDRILLLCTAIVIAGIAAISYRFAGEYSSVMNMTFAIGAIIVYIKRRRDRRTANQDNKK